MSHRFAIMVAAFLLTATFGQDLKLQGTVRNRMNDRPISGAIVSLANSSLLDTTDTAGVFRIGTGAAVLPRGPARTLRNGSILVSKREIVLNVLHKDQAELSLCNLRGELVQRLFCGALLAYTTRIPLPAIGNGMYVLKIRIGKIEQSLKLNFLGLSGTISQPLSPGNGKELLLATSTGAAPAQQLLVISADGFFTDTFLISGTSRTNQICRMIDTSSAHGIRKGRWSDSTIPHRFQLFVDSTGFSINNITVPPIGRYTAGLKFSGPCVLSRGRVKLTDSLSLFFSDSSVLGIFHSHETVSEWVPYNPPITINGITYYGIMVSEIVENESPFGGKWKSSIAAYWNRVGYVTGTTHGLFSSPFPNPIGYCAQEAGLYRSAPLEDSVNMNWRKLEPRMNSSPLIISAAALHPLKPQTLYAYERASLFLSADGGNTWSTLGLSPNIPGLAIGLAVTPGGTEDTVYLTVRGWGTYLWTQSMGSWKQILKIYPEGLVLDPIKHHTIFVVGAGTIGILRSANAGAAWDTLLQKEAVSCFAADAVDSALLYAVTRSQGLIKSEDYGKNWTSISQGLPAGDSVSALGADPKKPNVLYAGLNKGGVYRTTNRGAAWIAMNGELPAERVMKLAVVPGAPSERVLSITSSGMISLWK